MSHNEGSSSDGAAGAGSDTADPPHYYTYQWNLLERRPDNTLILQIVCLDRAGSVKTFVRHYRDWIGVCTGRIEHVVRTIQAKFPGEPVAYERIGDTKKILPYFGERIAKGKLHYVSKPFYKVYTSACHEDVGHFFLKYKISYFDAADWRARLYVDVCTRYDTRSFHYRWYHVLDTPTGPVPSLLDTFRMLPERNDEPNWTVAAFDLETVCLEGNHVPQGHVETDRIVMISLYVWRTQSTSQEPESYLLYLLPDGMDRPLDGYPGAYTSEKALLHDFHVIIQAAQILTGYNINAFDLPCLFARLFWLGMTDFLKGYSSRYVGQELVTTYRNKIVLDLYAYFKTFSGHDLPSFKLDDVARVKLKGESKIPIQSTGIWSWYRKASGLTRDTFESADPEHCFRQLRPSNVKNASKFGTFRLYLDYCLRDSQLVLRLFQKETCLSFLVERANFTSLDAVEALHLGNSSYLLELFKTYGTWLGYFFNAHFFKNDSREGRYQGGLNYCVPERAFENVAVMDFASMYPSTLLSNNLCYGTCAILPRLEAESLLQQQLPLTCIPYRLHSESEFRSPDDPPNAQQQLAGDAEPFSYPSVDPSRDASVIVILATGEAFLPCLVHHLIPLRRHHQTQFKSTGDVYHYNVQQGIKILLNSLYGIMGNSDSILAYSPIAMSVVSLARHQLLSSFRYIQRRRGFTVCYVDTDSLMVCGWPDDHCDDVNAYLNLPHVTLQFEQRFERLLVLSKKRYIYETSEGKLVAKGFSKKINELVRFMIWAVLERVWECLFLTRDRSESNGWSLWVSVLQEVHYKCRDPTRFSIYRKIKPLEEYKSTSCPSVRYLQKYPDRRNEYVEYTYTRADVAKSEALKWVTDAEECRWVNVDQLIMGPRATLLLLLKIAFWPNRNDAAAAAEKVSNTLLWKKFVHAELLHYFATGGRRLALLTLPGVRYTFSINDTCVQQRGPGRLPGSKSQQNKTPCSKRGKKPSLTTSGT